MGTKKKEPEQLPCIGLADGQFEKALAYARRKQAHIYEATQDQTVMQDWYFAELAEESAVSLALSRFTLDLCRGICNTEKERLTHQ